MSGMMESINVSESVSSVEAAPLTSYGNMAGHVVFTYRVNNEVEVYETDNAIVNVGRQMMCKILGNTETGRYIHKMGVGKGGALEASPFNPIPPTANDTQLVTEVSTGTYSRPTVSVTYPSATSAKFTAILNSNQVNENVNEAGLFFNLKGAETTAVMLARVTFPTRYLKADSGASLEINWTVTLG